MNVILALGRAHVEAFEKRQKRFLTGDGNQYGAADMEQLELLLQVLRLTPANRALDAGCGTGDTTNYLSERSGANFVGADKSKPSIDSALRRFPSLEFCVAELDALDFPPASFDAVIAIESMYFPKDLMTTVGQFKKLLRPGGRMGLFFTHLGAEGPASAAETKLGQALQVNGLRFEAHDLTESDRRFWQRSKETAEELLPEFEAEGNEDLLHLGETTAVLDLIQKGGHARFLYHVRAD